MAVLEETFSTTNVTSGFAVAGEVLLWLFVALLVGALIYLLYYITTFKHQLVIRDIAHGRKIISKLKWKEKKTKDGNIWLVTPFNKIKKPLPPSNAIELTKKGKKFVEAYRGEDTDTLVWIRDNFDYEVFKNNNINTFQPVTTQERELVINQLKKAYAYKKMGKLEIIMAVSIFMAPVIMIAIIGLTLGDITEALTTYSEPLTNTLNTVSENFVQASNNLAGIQTPEPIVNQTGVPN